MSARVLSSEGFDVRTFGSGTEAIAWLGRNPQLALVVSDLQLPDRQGWTLCRLLRSDVFEGYRDVPILATSPVKCDEDARGIAANLGVTSFLPAPFTTVELAECSRRLLAGTAPTTSGGVLLVVGPDGTFPGLAEAFRECGYRVDQVSDPNLVDEVVQTMMPEIVIVWGGSLPGLVRAALRVHQSRHRATMVMLEGPCPLSHARWLGEGADGCLDLRTPPLVQVNICERALRARALHRVHHLQAQRSQHLRDSQQTFDLLLEGIPDVALVFDAEGRILAVNDNGANRLHAPASNLVGRLVWDFLSIDSNREPWARTASCSYTARCVGFAGDPFDVEVHQSPVNFRNHRATLAIARDLTEREAAMEAVRVSEIKCRIIAENTYDWEFWRSPQGHFLYSSPACRRITGYHPVEFEMEPGFLERIAHPLDRHLLPDPTAVTLDGPEESEFRIIDRRANIRWLACTSRAIYDEQGNLLGTRGTIRDLTDHRAMEDERGRLVAAVEQCAEPIAITDLEGTLEYSNPAYRQTHAPGDREPAIDEPAVRQAVSRGLAWSGTLQRSLPGGTKLEIELTVSPVRDHIGVVRSLVWVEKDVTADKCMERRLLEAQRMEALGALAGGVAHDFNNLLGGILGYSSMLKDSYEPWEESYQAAQVIHTAASRAADLTQKLLGFARQGKNTHEAFLFHDTVREVVALLSRTLDRKIVVDSVLDAPESWVIGDASQMSQVLLNLAINATHAMEDGGGRLTLRTSNCTAAEASTRLPSPAPSHHRYLHVEVSDSGCGIAPENLKRIFEPFFTTKQKGSGLGLAMVYGIVGNHGGGVAVESEPGKGTTFHLYLPACDDPGPRPEPSRPPEPRPGRGRVLVVDDEELVRNMAAKMLRRLGYETVTARDGAEALDYYVAHPDSVDLVILDMIMPNVDGRQCFRNLRAADPGVRAILSTGYSLNQTVQEALDEGLLDYINKPYDFNQLADVVSRVLRDSGGS